MNHNVSRFEQTDAKITRYIDGEFYIYIVEDRNAAIPCYEYYLQQIGSGFMQYVYGSAINQPDCIYYKDKGGVQTVEDFIETVKAGLREDKADYLKELERYEDFLEQEAYNNDK